MEVRNIKMNACKLGKNSRLDIDKNEMSGLMESIKTEGLLQPIGVVKKSKGFEVVYGNRRFLAYSKLGFKTIPAVIQDDMERNEIDIKNLAENVQRSNLTLNEVGRYVELLERKGMNTKEIAVSLGVPVSYIKTAKTVFFNVPKKHRDDIVTSYGVKKLGPGKISMATVRLIEDRRRNHKLTDAQTESLYQAAKTQGFDYNNISKYIDKIVKSKGSTRGRTVVSTVNKTNKKIQLSVTMNEDDYIKIWKKYITNGAFTSMAQVIKAKLNGQISTPMKVR